MHVLGISTSKRRWGNTDILVHSVLRGATAQGATAEFLRAADLDLKPCMGCMSCVFKETDCVIKDRFGELLAAFRRADAVVFGCPTYVLGSNSVLHVIGERLIRYGATREFKGKTGVAVAAAGVPGWVPFVEEELSRFFLFLDVALVDRFIGYAQGPGEVLDDTAALERARRAGEALARGERQWLGETGSCPVCHLDLVSALPGGKGACTLCDIEGELEEKEGKMVLEPAPGSEPRWTEASMAEHFLGKILPSGPRFKARVKEVVAAVNTFKAEGNP